VFYQNIRELDFSFQYIAFERSKPNHCLQLTVKSVTKFAIANFPPLFTSAEAGVMCSGKFANGHEQRLIGSHWI
jgi:hypothetical protein